MIPFSSEKEVANAIDYRCNEGRFLLSSHDCQVPTPGSQNLDVGRQSMIFLIDDSYSKSRIINSSMKNYQLFMRERMRHDREQTTSSVAL
jgi:hypothetical protein